MINIKRSFLTILLFLSFIYISFAQIPAGYYDSTQGLYTAQLKTALKTIITNGHTQNDYASLWSLFVKTDTKPNAIANYVWDPYSDGNPTYHYIHNQNQCGNYSQEGDCYNREHSFPASYFGDAYPMYGDLNHLYPTDGYVNNRRSNFPFGKVTSPSWTSSNGSKLGPCTYPGYTGTVFEPTDSFKGDFARTYFYMVTRYEDLIVSWFTSAASGNEVVHVLDGTTYPALQAWQVNLFLQWNALDPVSQKEINRNDSVYAIQHNRNPFIDHPEFAPMIWSPDAFAYSQLSATNNILVYPNPAKEIFNVSFGNTMPNNPIFLLADITGKKIDISFNKQAYNYEFDSSTLPKGVYILTVFMDASSSTSFNFKIIK